MGTAKSQPACRSAFLGGLLNNPSDGLFCMPTVHRAGNLRFVVFLDDHGPPHVHVFSGGGEAKLLLGEADGRPSLVWARRMDRGNLRRAMAETLAHRAKLLVAWRRLHDSDRKEEE